MLVLTFNGRPLAEAGAWSLGEWTTNLQGPEDLAWVMRPGRPDPLLKPGQLIELWDGPTCVWAGTSQAPRRGAGAYTARGLAAQAYDTPALDGSGAVTTTPNTAIDQGIARGALRGWIRDDSIGSSALSSDILGEVPTIGELLDAAADEAGQWWRLTSNRRVELYSRPTEPRWMVTRDAGILDVVEGDYVSKLFGRRRTTGGGYATESATDTDAEAINGYRDATVDLTGLGVITQARAQNILAGMLSKGRARLGFANSVQASRWQILTLGGIQTHLPAIRAGQVARFFTQHDQSRYLQGRGYVDELIGRVIHPDGQPAVVELQPNGLVLASDWRDVHAYLASTEKHKRRHG